MAMAGSTKGASTSPEFPHGGLTTWTTYLSLASAFSCAIHYLTFRTDWLTQDLHSSIKIERAKEYANLWRTFFVSVTVGYTAVVISWSLFVWGIASSFFKDSSESYSADKLRLSMFDVIVVGVLAFYVLCGIVYEVFRKANEAGDLLLKINIERPPYGSSQSVDTSKEVE